MPQNTVFIYALQNVGEISIKKAWPSIGRKIGRELQVLCIFHAIYCFISDFSMF